MPYTFKFSVNDWPKSGDGIPTKLYVGITDTTNMAFGVDSVKLCVPDVKAPDIRISYPIAYQRVPIAKSSLNYVPVKAKVVSTSYDPDNPIRFEFFYQKDGNTDSVKIGESGVPVGDEYIVQWHNNNLTEGFYWLWAIVHDQVDNKSKTPPIKVWLDPSAPLMKLTIPDAMMVNGKLTITKPA